MGGGSAVTGEAARARTTPGLYPAGPNGIWKDAGSTQAQHCAGPLVQGMIKPAKNYYGRQRHGTLCFSRMRAQIILLGLLCWMPFGAVAKSYSSGGGSHSYSSKSSSYSSGSHGSYASSFSSSSPRKTSSFGSSSGNSMGSSFSSFGKTYSSGLNKQPAVDESRTGTHAAESGNSGLNPGASATASSGGTSKFFSPPKRKTSAFDSEAAEAQQHQESQKAYSTWKTANTGTSPKTGTYSGTYGGPPGGTYSGPRDNDYRPPPMHRSYASQNTTPVYGSTHTLWVTRPVRLRQTFYAYYDRPQVSYNDPYSSVFWWWLLDQSIDSRAQWAYNHRYTMDPLRYQLLMNDADLANRVQALEAQQPVRNSNFTPNGLDQDLMYNDAYAQNPTPVGASQPGSLSTPGRLSNPNNPSSPAGYRPGNSGRILFWALMLPAAGCIGAFVIWGVFFKRWA